MLQQLSVSRNGMSYRTSVAPLLSGEEWYRQRERALEQAVAYHADNAESERRRAAERTGWLRALKASLDGSVKS